MYSRHAVVPLWMLAYRYLRSLDAHTGQDLRAALSSQCLNTPLKSTLYCKNPIADFGDDNTCCETDRCDINNQTVYLSLSPNQQLHLSQKSPNFSDLVHTALSKLELNSPPASRKTVPIYTLTQSIVC